jgi:Uma2 family endonuclease
MASTTLITSQKALLSQDNEALYEVVDDHRVELAPMGAYEARLASVLLVRLETFARQHHLGRAVQEMLFDLTAIIQRKHRPDVAFVLFDRWPQQRRVPRTEAWEVVPNLVVEVISPSDTGEHVMDKIADVHILTRTDVLHGEPILPQFRLQLAELFDDVEAAVQP